jgi:hypothetical protein
VRQASLRVLPQPPASPVSTPTSVPSRVLYSYVVRRDPIASHWSVVTTEGRRVGTFLSEREAYDYRDAISGDGITP